MGEFEIFISSRFESVLKNKLTVRFLTDDDSDILFDAYPEDRIVDYFRKIFEDVIIFAINKAKIDKKLNYIIFISVELPRGCHVSLIQFRYTNGELTGDFHSLYDLVNSISEFETESEQYGNIGLLRHQGKSPRPVTWVTCHVTAILAR